MAKITDEMFARIPELIAQGENRKTIAALYNTTPGSLQVQCSQRKISLMPKVRKNSPRQTLELWPSVPLPLTATALVALRSKAKEMEIDTAQLASRLLQAIVRDNLFVAVLDTDGPTPKKSRIYQNAN